MDITVKIDDRGLKQFTEAMEKQVPFATALALTRTAGQGQDRVREELPKHFTLRNKFTEGSIRFKRAEKRDWPNCKAIVGTISPYLEIQEEGGDKTADGKAFAIPKGIRRSDKTQVSRAKWPGKILPKNSAIPGGGRTKGAVNGKRSKPKPFLIREKDGVGVYIRTDKKGKLKRLFRLTRKTLHVKRRDWLQAPVEAIVRENLGKNFDKALDDAIKPRA